MKKITFLSFFLSCNKHEQFVASNKPKVLDENVFYALDNYNRPLSVALNHQKSTTR